MQGNNPVEYGITSVVRTISSRSTLQNVIDFILSKKINGVLDWLYQINVRPANCLVIGAYLTGSGIANCLVAQTSVTVVDMYPHLRDLLHPGVSFVTRIDDIADLDWDFVMDTSGIGGLDPGDIQKIHCSNGVFLVEDPTSDGSDELIRKKDPCCDRLWYAQTGRRGILRTTGLGSKTSGTMTLSMDVLRRAMEDAVQMEGVLYSTASMDFSERILFRDKDTRRFLEALERSALTVSSLKEIDCDVLIRRNLSMIKSRVFGFS